MQCYLCVYKKKNPNTKLQNVQNVTGEYELYDVQFSVIYNSKLTLMGQVLMYGCRYIYMYLLICYSLQFLQACGGACSVAPSIHIICQTIFVFRVYLKGGSCSQPTSILKWLLVILPNYRNKLHAVNLFCVFVFCVVLMCRLITLTHDPVFYVPCGGVPSSPYRKRRVLCTGIELLL